MVKFDHLRINCQKILPAVYGDSLSYYETLCKLQKAVNDLVDYLATFEDEILMQHLRDLKNYIDRELSMIQGQLDLVKSDLQGVKQTISINMQTINAKIAQIESDLAQKQNQYAPGLATVNKTIEGAINEIYAIILTKYTFPDGGIPMEDLSPELQQLLEEIPYLLIDKADVIIDSAGPANPLSITDGGNDLPLESMTINAEPIQDPAPYISNTADQDPYNFRAFPAAASGANREYEMLVGGSVAWNQLAGNGKTTGTYINLSITNNGDGSLTITGTPSSTAIGIVVNFGKTVAGHKILIRGGSNSVRLRGYSSLTFANCDSGNGIIITANSENEANLAIQMANTSTAVSETIRPQAFDLTKMFGSTIADTMTVDLFRKYFPDPYYSYDAGSIQSVSVSEKVTSGKNQIIFPYETASGTTSQGVLYTVSADGKLSASGTTTGTSSTFILQMTNPIKVCAGTYTLSKTGNFGNNATLVRCYKNSVTSANEITALRIGDQTPSATYTFTEETNLCIIVRCNNNGQAVNFSNVAIQLELGSTPTTYVPYTADASTLDHTQLRGIPKIVDGELQYDGDLYQSSGSVVRKYGIVDLGTFTWAIQGGYVDVFYATVPGIKPATRNTICEYIKINSGLLADKEYLISGTTIYIKDSNYSSESDFKTAMNGVNLVYELATATTETATAYANPRTIEPSGTESFTDYPVSQGTRDVSIPVGHITYYGVVSDISANTQVDITKTTDDGSETYTIQLPYPSYGGTLDPLSGLYISKFDIVDFGDLTWYYNATYKRFSASIDNAEGFPLDSVAPVYASGYAKTSVNDLNSDLTMNGVIAVNNAGTVFVRNLSFDDAATFTNAMRGQKIAYLSTDSVSFDVTPVAINTALGNNSFSTGTGTISMDYRADTKLYIDNKINALMAVISEL